MEEKNSQTEETDTYFDSEVFTFRTEKDPSRNPSKLPSTATSRKSSLKSDDPSIHITENSQTSGDEHSETYDSEKPKFERKNTPVPSRGFLPRESKEEMIAGESQTQPTSYTCKPCLTILNKVFSCLSRK